MFNEIIVSGLRTILPLVDSIVGCFKKKKIFRGAPKKVLFVRWDRIGDAVVTLPVIKAFKQVFPRCEVQVLCSEGNKFVFENNKYIDKLIVFPGIGREYGFFKALFWLITHPKGDVNLRNRINLLQDENYDVVIDFVEGEKTLFLNVGKYFIGLKTEEGRSWIYDYYPDKTLRESFEHYTEYMSHILENFFGKKMEIRPPEVPIKKTKEADKLLHNIKKPFLIVNINASIPEKALTKEQIEGILELRISTVIMDDPIRPRKEISPIIKNKGYKNTVIFPNTGFSLPEWAYVAKKCKLYIGPDGGPSQYISSVAPSIIIFGPTGPWTAWRPLSGAKYESSILLHSKNTRILVMKSKKHIIIISEHPSVSHPSKKVAEFKKDTLELIDATTLQRIILSN